MGELLDVYSPKQVAQRLGIKEARVRDLVRKEVGDRTPDIDRFIRGGRVDHNVMAIFATVFDAVTSGSAVCEVALHSRFSTHHVDTRASQLLTISLYPAVHID